MSIFYFNLTKEWRKNHELWWNRKKYIHNHTTKENDLSNQTKRTFSHLLLRSFSISWAFDASVIFSNSTSLAVWNWLSRYFSSLMPSSSSLTSDVISFEVLIYFCVHVIIKALSLAMFFTWSIKSWCNRCRGSLVAWQCVLKVERRSLLFNHKSSSWPSQKKQLLRLANLRLCYFTYQYLFYL